MTITYTPAVAPMGAVAIHRAVSAVSNLIDALRDWNDARRTANTLSYLKADVLEDIGMTKADFSRRSF
jgi:uncharacterized protein YjiS (DUF1127 family)